MENHSFSKARLVVELETNDSDNPQRITNDITSQDDTSSTTTTSFPTWEVDVLRNKNKDVVATLRINALNFPPRRNKKNAIVWKLPDTADKMPNFGQHEHQRLWEMYKNRKKERRKKKKEEPTMEESDPSRTAFDNGKETLGSKIPDNQAETKVADPSIEKNAIEKVESEIDKTQSLNNCIENVKSPVTTSETTALPPPPPGFANPDETRNSSDDEIPFNNNNHNIIYNSPTAANTGPSLFNIDPATSTQGTIIASLFLQHIPHEEGCHAWCTTSYRPDATSIFVVGTAQALASTPHERWVQWKALVSPAWECHTTLLHPIDANTVSAPFPQNSPRWLVTLNGHTRLQLATSHEVKVFSFNLTWILQDQQIIHEVLSLFPLP